MADQKKRLAKNAQGEFFVDSTCINCDTCRQLAPLTFDESGDYSYVRAQPKDQTSKRAAAHAVLCCPTASIGCHSSRLVKDAIADFPLKISENVYYCGFCSPRSYGGSSYFIADPAGNWLVDSPRFTEPLSANLRKLGGVKHIFLTHSDDVADAGLWSDEFGAQRIIHIKELEAQPTAEIVLSADEPVEIMPDYVAIPTPGHTAGHMVLLYKEKYLFSGDHLAWDRDLNCLTAHRDYCWHSWDQQTMSMRSLKHYKFQWILPGHGDRYMLSQRKMLDELEKLIKKMMVS